MRITVQLIHGPSDRHLWAETFEADIRDELAVENNIATKIADQVHAKITSQEYAQLKKVHPVNPKALDAYLEARYHLDQADNLYLYHGRQQAREAEMAKAVAYLDQAVKEDPNYVPAYLAYFDRSYYEDSNLPLPQRVKPALQRALEIDEDNVQAHLLLARLLMQYEYDWTGAEREIRTAIQKNPNSGDAHNEYAEFLDNFQGVQGGFDQLGDTPEAKKERELAQSLDPAHDYYALIGLIRLGMTLDEQRKVIEEKTPNAPFPIAALAKEYAIAGRFKESVEMWERCLTLYGWNDFADVLKRANARGGPKYALAQWMRAFEEYSKTHEDAPVYTPAFTYASLGDKDRAFAWLDKAVTERNWCIIYLKRDNVWDPLRSDPRFSALLRRVGLPHDAAH